MRLIKMILFCESRKVGFGLWLFIVATTLLTQELIMANDWVLCVILSSTLLGGGTIGDRILEAKFKGPKNNTK